jgi:hypothetical protein
MFSVRKAKERIFFFEKKKQKTFVRWSLALTPRKPARLR